MLKYVKAVILLLPRLLVSYVWIFRYSRHPERFSYLKRYEKSSKICAKVLKAFNVKYYIDGYENLPCEQSYLLTPNHQSVADPLVFLSIFKEPTTFVAKKEIEKYPLIGRIVKAINGEFIDRDNLRQEMNVMKAIKKSLLYDNRRWIIFPEGTRTKDKNMELGEFKAGALKPALSTEKKIVPVAIYGTFRVFDTKYKNREFPVQIRFLEPVDPSQYQGKNGTEIAPLIEKRIREEVDKMRLRDQELIKKL